MRAWLLLAILLVSALTPLAGLAREDTVPGRSLDATQSRGSPSGVTIEDELLLKPVMNISNYIVYRVNPAFRVAGGDTLPLIAMAMWSGSTDYIEMRYAENGSMLGGYYSTGSILVAGITTSSLSTVYFFPISYYYTWRFSTDEADWGQIYTGSYRVVFYGNIGPDDAVIGLEYPGSQDVKFYRCNESGFRYLYTASLPDTIYLSASKKIAVMDVDTDNGVIMLVYDRRYPSNSPDTEIHVAILNLADGSVEASYSYDIGSSADADYATTMIKSLGVRLADADYPWYAGVGLESLRLFTFNAETGEWHSFDIRSSYANMTWIRLFLVRAGGQELVLLAGLNVTSSPYTPELFLIDPSTGSVVKHASLEGFPSTSIAVDRGYYGGIPVLYVGVQNYLLIIDQEDLSILGVRPTGVYKVYAVDYGESRGVELVAVGGYDSSGAKRSEIYSVGGIARAVKLSLYAPGKAYTGEPVNVSVSLRDSLGQPLQGATVLVEELTGQGWEPVASLLTGPDGNASGSIILAERGEHVLRAHYLGGDGYTAAYSRPVRVDAYDRAVVSIRVSPNSTVEGVPANAVVSVTGPGGPLSGVWVSVLVNTTSGWAIAGAGVTGDQGTATVPLSLGAGTYTVTARIMSSYIEAVSVANDTLRVYPPLEPPPSGPYVAPAGRVLAFAPPMAEAGRQAVVVFAFYYGESLADPESVEAVVSPSAPYTVEEVMPGVYRVLVTPGGEGMYTVVLRATYNYAVYVGAASFYAYSVQERVEEWNQTLTRLAERLESLNDTLTGYLENITSALESLNMTRLLGMVESINSSVATVIVRLGSLEDAANTIIANLTVVRGTVLENWRLIQGLNETLASAASSLGAGINNITVMVSRNGELLAVINTSMTGLADYLESMNASITGLVEARTGELYALISTRTGTILANLSTIMGVLDKLNATVSVDLLNNTLKIVSRLGTISTSIDKALQAIDTLEGVVEKVNASTGRIMVEVRTAEANITMSLEELKPRVEAVYGSTLLLNTSIGRVLADLDSLGNSASAILAGINQASTKLDKIGSSLASISSKLDAIQSSMQAVSGEKLEQASSTAESAKKIATAATALGALGTILGGAQILLRRP